MSVAIRWQDRAMVWMTQVRCEFESESPEVVEGGVFETLDNQDGAVLVEPIVWVADMWKSIFG